ncbi:choice-of-anchor Q domain-containing protein [Spirosoma validum]|uniref:Ig-like domain-containing protein n=1 Tax=Spirosoma validum TaxID=2771355 RepID=A0A927GHI9_9BACT|nr:choice-of-anchor Q domain-containing protein [Spirosoma validum]MBD2757705.1 hypothetical protein [Spirosoma validum]
MKPSFYELNPWVKTLLVLIVLSALGGPSQAQTIRYVSTTGTATDPASATSWAASTTALQGAIDASNPGDQVWIAGGTYKQVIPLVLNTLLDTLNLPTEVLNLLNQDNGFRMKNGVAIYGGFTGQEARLDQRPTSSPSSTILSGDIIIPGGLVGPGLKSRHVIYNTGLDHTAVLDGVVITAGGGGANQLLVSLSTGLGGGICNLNSSPRFMNCLIQGNTGTQGGGVYNESSSPQFTNCTIQGNTISGPIAILSGAGGGMTNKSSSPVLTNCRIIDNASVVQGGGLYNDRSSPLLINCVISGNSANQGGGVASINYSSPRFVNSLIRDNSAGLVGAGIYDEASNLTMTNCTITANRGGTASAIFHGTGLQGLSPGPIWLTNCIIYNSGTFVFEPTAAHASYCLFGKRTNTDRYGFPIPPPQGTGNLILDEATDAYPFVSYFDATLIACSPAINAGDPNATTDTNGSTDLAGNPRLVDSAIDMGAYEFAGLGSAGGFPIRILQQPASGSAVTASSTVTATVGVSGSNPTYQWYKNDLNSPVSGQTSATLTLTNVQLSDEGVYFAVVTGCNALTSTSFFLNLELPIRYVKVGGTGYGSSWTDAAGDLQAMINKLGQHQVYVAGGRYTSSASPGSFIMRNGVAIYGGFNPDTPESSPANRASVNPLTNLPFSTTLTANLPSSTTTVITNPGNVLVNVITNRDLDHTAILDGFIITGGYANGSSGTNNLGGGLYNSNSNPRLLNCILRQNTAQGNGGGLYNTNSSPTLINCSVQANQALGNGGGLYNVNFSSPQLINCLLWGNTASLGKAIDNLNYSRPTLTNCISWNHDGPSAFLNEDGNSSLTASFCLIEPDATNYNGSNTLTGDPRFVNAAGGNFRLMAGSPAVNAGSPDAYTAASGPATDLAGQSRLSGGVIDLGPYEYQALPTPPIRYVRQNGTGDGTSWASAAGDLQSQVNAPGVTQVWVAAGTYTPGPDRTDHFSLKNGVSILGGFPPAGTPPLTDRNPASYTTILSGDIGQLGDNTDNSYQVVSNTNSGLDGTAVLEGFLITGGNGNSGGGGVRIENGSPRLVNCLLTGNRAYQGGGLYTAYSSLTLINCTLSGNTADYGGGIYTSRGTVVVINGLIRDNTATSDGGGYVHQQQWGHQPAQRNAQRQLGGPGRGAAQPGQQPQSGQQYCLCQWGSHYVRDQHQQPDLRHSHQLLPDRVNRYRLQLGLGQFDGQQLPLRQPAPFSAPGRLPGR